MASHFPVASLLPALYISRRITAEHRLVYGVAGTGEAHTLVVAMCRYHY